MQKDSNQDKELLETVALAAKTIDEKFGKDIKVLYLGEITTLADYFVIATANNTSQSGAICQEIEDVLKKHGTALMHSEGAGSGGGWALLDYGTIVFHIFLEEERKFYDLERLWGDASEIEINYK